MNASGDPSALKLFVSYSRSDAAAADALVEDLEAAGFEVMIDRRDLPFGEEWQAELRDFILQSDTVLWLVSPTSVGSRWVNWELGEVQRAKKRLMPVVVSAIAPDSLPDALGKLHLLPAEGAFDRDAHLGALIEALQTDRAWIKEHTRLSDRAREWRALEDRRPGSGRDRLLRGAALSDAEAWRSKQPKAAPLPGGELLDLLVASELAAKRRQRVWVGGSLVIAAGAIALAAFALVQQQLAVENERIAVENERRAETEAALARAAEARAREQRDSALTTQSRFLADLSDQQLRDGRQDAGRAVLLALEGLPDEADPATERPWVREAEAALNQGLSSLAETLVVQGPDTYLGDLAFSPEGTRLITNAGVWDAATGERLRRFDDAEDPFHSAVFHPDGKRVFVRGRETPGRLIDLETDAVLVAFEDPDIELEGFVGAQFTREGDQLVGFFNGRVVVWDAETGAPLRHFDHDVAGGLWAYAVSPHGDTVAGSGYGGLFTADLESGERLAFRDMQGQGMGFGHYDVTYDLLAATTGSRTGVILDRQTGETLVELVGHDREVTSAAFSPQMIPSHKGVSMVVTTSDDGSARIWNAETGEELARLDGHSGSVWPAAFSPDGTRVVAGGDDGVLRIWDVERAISRGINRLPLESTPWVEKGKQFIRRVSQPVFTPDGTRIIASVSGDKPLFIWDSQTGANVGALAFPTSIDLTFYGFTPDGAELVAGDPDQLARWRLADGALVEQIDYAADERRLLAVSPDARRAIVADKDPLAAQLVDLSTGDAVADLTFAEERMGSPVFSGDGARIAAMSLETRITQIWDVDTGAELARFTMPADDETVFSRIGHVALSAGGRYVALANGARSAVIWDIDEGRERVRLIDPEVEVTRVAFSPEGDRIFTLGAAIIEGEGFTRLRVWDAETGRIVASFSGAIDPMGRLSVSADGARLMSGSHDATAHIWEVPETGQALVEIAKSRSARCLTQEERAGAFLPPEPPRWCITGAGLQAELDPAQWRPLWPYRAPEWRDWLIARDRGENPPLPAGG